MASPFPSPVPGDVWGQQLIDAVESRTDTSHIEANLPPRLAETALNATYATAFKPEKYGAVADGTTDDTAAVQAAIQAAYDAGGGTVQFGPKTYRINGQLTTPKGTGTQFPSGRSLRLTGAGFDVAMGTTSGSTYLDMRYAGADAKLVVIGQGMIEIDHLTMIDKGASSTPFILITQATPRIHDVGFVGNTTKSLTTCDQDAIILGGTIAQHNNTVTSQYSGYGGSIVGCTFDRIRRTVYGRAAVNSVVVSGNWIGSRCGGDATAAAIHFDGTVDQATSNMITDNTIEVTGYVYGIRFTNSGRNHCLGNAFWDETETLVACYYLEGDPTKTTQNMLGGLFTSLVQYPKKVKDDTTGNNSTYSVISNGELQPKRLSAQQTVVQPELATNDETWTTFGVKRSVSDTNPNNYSMSVQQRGRMYLGGSWSTAAAVHIQNGTNTLSITDGVISRSAAGHIELWPGTAATDTIKIMRGALKQASYTTATRPSASGVGAGATIYDTTLGKPIWSDGTNWKDATGTIV